MQNIIRISITVQLPHLLNRMLQETNQELYVCVYTSGTGIFTLGIRNNIRFMLFRKRIVIYDMKRNTLI